MTRILNFYSASGIVLILVTAFCLCFGYSLYEGCKMLSCLSVIYPMYAAIKNYDKLKSTFGLLFLYLILASITETYGIVTVVMGVSSNMEVYGLFIMAEVTLLGTLYYRFITNDIARKVIILMIAIFDCIALYEYVGNPKAYSTFTWTVSNYILSLCAMIYFVDQMTTAKKAKRDPLMTWVNFAVFAFFPNTQLIYLFSQGLSPEIRPWFWNISVVMNILYHIILAYGLFNLEKKSPLS